jgi:beta-glucosidase
MTDTALTRGAAELAADFPASGEAAQRASITVLTNRALRTGWADPDPKPMLPLALGLKLYVEGIDPAVAAEYGELVTTPEEADAAILRLQASFHADSPEFAPDAVDHVRAVAAAVPTVVDVFADRPVILEPVVDVAAAVTLDGGVSAAALLDVLTGAAQPQGRLGFDLPRPTAAAAASGPDLSFDTLFRVGHGLGI